MTRNAFALIAIFISSLGAVAAPSEAMGPCEREMTQASRAEGVPLSVLYSVALTETGQHGRLQPYALNIDGVAVIATSLPEAMQVFAAAQGRGAKFIDIGCMQINQRWHGAHFASLEAMFDAHLNVAYAARFLKALRAREASWTMAVARYNAGPDNDAGQKRYVCAVIGNMVRSGLGAWTENARKFCSPGGA